MAFREVCVIGLIVGRLSLGNGFIELRNMKGWMYILECNDGSYYIGSTRNLERRILQHQDGEGALHTRGRLPVKLVYFEVFNRVDYAFYREKQVQGWSRRKKEALISLRHNDLHALAKCGNETSHRGFGSAQPPCELPCELPCEPVLEPGCQVDLEPGCQADLEPGCQVDLESTNEDVKE